MIFLLVNEDDQYWQDVLEVLDRRAGGWIIRINTRLIRGTVFWYKVGDAGEESRGIESKGAFAWFPLSAAYLHVCFCSDPTIICPGMLCPVSLQSCARRVTQVPTMCLLSFYGCGLMQKGMFVDLANIYWIFTIHSQWFISVNARFNLMV